MTTKRVTSHLLDRRKLLEDCDEELAFARKCLHVFVKETHVDLKNIASAFDRKKLRDVARLAHRIKGASASIRAEFLRQRAAILEAMASDGDSIAADACFARLQAEFELFSRYVASLPRID
jgi:HPt (histidine-containing phosphotransfer) domain-containing protein